MNAQTVSETVKGSLYTTCNLCDSLYNQICPDNSTVFRDPERLASFPGGTKALMAFINNHLQYPAKCAESSIQGRVAVQFIIDKCGKIICPRIVKSLHPLMDEETLRIVKLMPDWEPASNGNVLYDSCFILPFRFKL